MKTKEEALASIACNVRCINGKRREMWDVFIGRVPSTGKIIRFSHYTREETEAHVRKFFAERKTMGDAAAQLRPAQVFDALEAYSLLDKAGACRHLSDIVREWLGGKSRDGTATINPDAGKMQVGKAYDEYFTSFDIRQKAHRSAIRVRVGGWVAAFGGRRPLSDVSLKEVQSYLDKLSGSDKTFNNHAMYIKSFLSWCAAPERGYLAENPLAYLKPRKLTYSEPEYMTVGDVEKIMRAFEMKHDKTAIAYCALSFFCGVRTEEIQRIAEEDSDRAVSLDDGTVRIARPKGYVQGMMPRVFVAPENAMEWLRAIGGCGSLHGRNIEKLRGRIAKDALAVGAKIPHNGGRHSFITYHVAAYGDPAKTEAKACSG